jgi:hypothetical protein
LFNVDWILTQCVDKINGLKNADWKQFAEEIFGHRRAEVRGR